MWLPPQTGLASTEQSACSLSLKLLPSDNSLISFDGTPHWSRVLPPLTGPPLKAPEALLILEVTCHYDVTDWVTMHMSSCDLFLENHKSFTAIDLLLTSCPLLH